MKIHYYVGNDNGNSEHAIIINGKLELQPNVNCIVDNIPWSEEQSPESFIKDLQGQLIVSIRNSSIVKNGMYYIGRFALESGEVLNNMQVGIDIKSEVDLPIINTLSQISARAVQDAYEQMKKIPEDLIEVTVDMATALPVTQYTKETSNTFEKKFMDNPHDVIVHLGRREVPVRVTFDFVKTVPEATPATFSLQKGADDVWRHDKIFVDFYNTYKKELPAPFTGEYFANKRILHVDIGDGTTEYPVTEGNQFLRQFVYGSNHGVGHAIEEALPEFNKLIFIPDSPRQFLSDVIKNDDHKYYDRAMKTLRRPLEAQAQQIVKNIIKQLTKARNEMDIICIYGGGSITMRDFLEPMVMNLCNEREIKLFYVPTEYSTTLNVEGLDLFCKGKIYLTLKNRIKIV